MTGAASSSPAHPSKHDTGSPASYPSAKDIAGSNQNHLFDYELDPNYDPSSMPSSSDRSFLEASIPDIVNKLTLNEKIDLLAGKNWWETVPIPRLHIPSVKVSDGPNGARGGSFFKMTAADVLPNATCLGATFSSTAATDAGHLLAAEAKARGAACLLGPTINIQRSPLGGRAFESFSEDPTLSGHIAAAYVNGLQEHGVSATMKHFIANDMEHERNGQDSIVAPRPLRELYLRPFQIAQRLAKPHAYMTSYNKLNGTHPSENKWLLKDLLRKEWQFDGLVMSDWYGTYSVSDSINAGLDLEMPGPAKWRNSSMVQHVIAAHKIDPRTIDERAAEILGWVQWCARASPDVVYGDHAETTREDAKEADAKILRRLATEGITLLKNDNKALPIKQGTVAVIGPNAKAKVISGGGSALLRAFWTVTPWDGLVDNKPKGVALDYALGCVGTNVLPTLDPCFATVDGKHGWFNLNYYAIDGDKIAENPTFQDVWDRSDMFMADFQHPDLPGHYVTELLTDFTSPITGDYEFGLIGTGKSWLNVDGKEVIDNAAHQKPGTAFFGNGTAEERASVPVVKGQTYRIRMVHDSRRPAARRQSSPFVINGLRLGGFPVVDGDAAIAEAVEAAKKADHAVLVVGLSSTLESEGFDRPTLSLPLRTDELIAKVAAVNKNTTVVIQAGSAISMPWLDDVASVVYAWYGGNETGNAIADVVYGKAVPSGRLPLSLPRSEKDIAASLNYKSARTRTYYDEGIWVGYKHHNARDIAPLFPFGHGLSYTTFKYSDLSLEGPFGNTAQDWRLKAAVTVTNTGDVAADHSVHFYTAPPPETATGLLHPEVSLQAFTKVYKLAPGRSERVEVELDRYAISHWDEHYDTWRAETGTWAVKVGVDAQTMVEAAEFEVKDHMEWRGL